MKIEFKDFTSSEQGIALITGTRQDIGRAIALRLASDGALASIRNGKYLFKRPDPS